MVALERENPHAAEERHRTLPKHARVRAEPQGVSAILGRAVKAQAKWVCHVVRGGKRPHAHAARLELVGGSHELKRQRREVLAAACRACRGHEPSLVLVAEDGQAARVVAVLVCHDDAPNAVHVHTQLVGPAHELAARQAVVDEHGALRSLHHGSVALGTAREDVQVHERRDCGRLLGPGKAGIRARIVRAVLGLPSVHRRTPRFLATDSSAARSARSGAVSKSPPAATSARLARTTSASRASAASADV